MVDEAPPPRWLRVDLAGPSLNFASAGAENSPSFSSLLESGQYSNRVLMHFAYKGHTESLEASTMVSSRLVNIFRTISPRGRRFIL